MSKSINRVTILGNIGKDAETKFTPSGVAKSTFSVATSRSYKKGDEWQEETQWHNVCLWRNEGIANQLLKGARVFVDGRVEYRSYEGRDGQKKYITEIVADNVILCGSTGGAKPARASDWNASDGMSSPKDAAPALDIDDPDVLF